MFADMIPERRLFMARDGVEFHDEARRAGVQRWVIHQLDAWQEGPQWPKHPASLATRWWEHAATAGGGRFVVHNNGLTHIGDDGTRRNCILGAALELFRDDYPAAIASVNDRKRGLITYRAFEPGEDHDAPTTKLPDIVRRELGLVDEYGSFQLSPAVVGIISRRCGRRSAHATDCLMGLTDRTCNWPLMAEVMAEPSAKLFLNG